MFEYPAGATPLDPDEVDGLIPAHIMNQSQLNEWEQMNILEAEKWVSRQIFCIDSIAGVTFIKKLHQRMFNKTWEWSGEFRRSNKNIGIDWLSIPVDLKVLIDDLKFQIDNKTYSVDELAARFHHRLVAIHPFANGNGRHARLMTDIILLSQKAKRFTWGRGGSLVKSSIVRQQYIAALRAADKMDYSLLMDFVR
ncbi:MAG: mobile mystery protein B [Gammaproteobacteria bacterium]|nr:mobile mystery protein B [Gammaproteobacteria bacterium]